MRNAAYILDAISAVAFGCATGLAAISQNWLLFCIMMIGVTAWIASDAFK